MIWLQHMTCMYKRRNINKRSILHCTYMCISGQLDFKSFFVFPLHRVSTGATWVPAKWSQRIRTNTSSTFPPSIRDPSHLRFQAEMIEKHASDLSIPYLFHEPENLHSKALRNPNVFVRVCQQTGKRYKKTVEAAKHANLMVGSHFPAWLQPRDAKYVPEQRRKAHHVWKVIYVDMCKHILKQTMETLTDYQAVKIMAKQCLLFFSPVMLLNIVYKISYNTVSTPRFAITSHIAGSVASFQHESFGAQKGTRLYKIISIY